MSLGVKFFQLPSLDSDVVCVDIDKSVKLGAAAKALGKDPWPTMRDSSNHVSAPIGESGGAFVDEGRGVADGAGNV